MSNRLPNNIWGMTYTQATWVFWGVGLLIIETIALLRHDPPLTDAMRAGSGRWMLWAALTGTFMGHFFGERSGPAWGPYVLIVLGLAVLYRDLFLRSSVPGPAQTYVFLGFYCLGAALFGRGP